MKNKRLIYADVVEKTFRATEKTILSEITCDYDKGWAHALASAADIINRTPTVDAVEVVRCKDCKYAENMMPINNSNGYLMGDCTLRKEDDIIVTAWEDEFCSYGERKDNG